VAGFIRIRTRKEKEGQGPAAMIFDSRGDALLGLWWYDVKE
jgi:hypothetical protein